MSAPTDIMTELTALCAGLREVVQPFLGLHAARAHAGEAVGGAARPACP